MNTKVSKQANSSNELYKLLCPVDLFRYFIRKQYENIKVTNEEIEEIRVAFAEYLEDLNLTDEQKANILPKDTFDVIVNNKHPFRMHGFPAGYVLHFSLFIEKMKKEAKKRGISK